ncbi:Glucose-6-phosphate/phosphate translocator 1, chloroplastic [Porphyridium purpureum]|uniref:Glucose-6-phosphate/phosphate translocator 1, chloroplastic n=1 Tax=Porphyridium purpureum TaxID=35688 RepID=A0A5J4YVD8_PORPP|nr:Glucose-6-phosphate/phosphate translocator 1, chloroplastic [Porphyridium purpureum]|eukprot:POR4020..scf227_4
MAFVTAASAAACCRKWLGSGAVNAAAASPASRRAETGRDEPYRVCRAASSVQMLVGGASTCKLGSASLHRSTLVSRWGAKGGRRMESAPVRAASAAGEGDADAKAAAAEKAKVGLYIGLWYAFNIVYNISNKKSLNWLALPWFVSWAQLVVGALWYVPLWALGLRKTPKLSKDNIRTLLPVSIAHLIGHVSTVVALGAVAVSFTHVIKSMEPFFNVMGSAIFLKEVFPLPVYVSLIPIVAGVTVASVSEVSFTWFGFLSAMTSNVAFTVRNLISKANMNTPLGENMDEVNLFSVIQAIAAVIFAPFALAMDGPKLVSAWKAATTGATAVTTSGSLIFNIALAGLFFQLYQEVSYLALGKIAPVSHAVANTMKRVVIILTSLVVFKNPITKANILGSSIAIAGVLAYSLVKNHYASKKKSKSA